MIRFERIIHRVLNSGVQKNVFSSNKVFSRFSSITTWNKDWKPGPYPKTEEERMAAARKYNLIPEDYEPYPEEEGFGDYPKFPNVHNENKDDFNVYDFTVLKRNYGEPVHPDFDLCIEDRVNFQKEYPVSPWKQILIVASVVGLYSANMIYSFYHPRDKLMIPKQYPYRGEKSYTFEPAE